MAIDNKNDDGNASEIIKSQLASAYIDGVASYGGVPEQTETHDTLTTVKSTNTESPTYQLPDSVSPNINESKIQTLANMQILPEEINNIRETLRARKFEDMLDIGVIYKLFSPDFHDPDDNDNIFGQFKDKRIAQISEYFDKTLELGSVLQMLTKYTHMPHFVNAKGQLIARSEKNYGRTVTSAGGQVSSYLDDDFFKMIVASDKTMDRQWLYTNHMHQILDKSSSTVPGSGQPIDKRDQHNSSRNVARLHDVIGRVHELTGIPIDDLSRMTVSAFITQCLHIAEFELRYGASLKFLKTCGLGIDLSRTTPAPGDLDSSHATIYKINKANATSLEQIFRFSVVKGNTVAAPTNFELAGGADSRPDLLGWNGTKDSISLGTGEAIDYRHPYQRMKTIGGFFENDPLKRLTYIGSLIGRENVLSDGLVNAVKNIPGSSKANYLAARYFPPSMVEEILGVSHGADDGGINHPPLGWKRFNGCDIWAYFIGKTHEGHHASSPLYDTLALGHSSNRCGYTSLLEGRHGGDDQRVLTYETGDQATDVEMGLNRFGTKKILLNEFKKKVLQSDAEGNVNVTNAVEFLNNELHSQVTSLKQHEKLVSDLLKNYVPDDSGAEVLGQDLRYLPRKVIGAVFQEVGKLILAATDVYYETGHFSLEELDKTRSVADLYEPGDMAADKGYTPGTALLSLVFAAHYLSENKKGTSNYKKLKRLFLKRVAESYFMDHGTSTFSIAGYLRNAADEVHAAGDTENNSHGAHTGFEPLSLPSAVTGYSGFRQLNPNFKSNTLKKLLPKTLRVLKPGAQNQNDVLTFNVLSSVFESRVGFQTGEQGRIDIEGLDAEGMYQDTGILGYTAKSITGVSTDGGNYEYDETGLHILRSAIGNDIHDPVTDSPSNRKQTLKYQTFKILGKGQLHQPNSNPAFVQEAAMLRTKYSGFARHESAIGFETRGFVFAGAAFRTTAASGNQSLATYHAINHNVSNISALNQYNPFNLHGPLNPTILGRGLIDAILKVAVLTDPITREATNTNIQGDNYGDIAFDSVDTPETETTEAQIYGNVNNVMQGGTGQGSSIAHGLDRGDHLALITEAFLTVINMFLSGQATAGKLNSILRQHTPVDVYYKDTYDGLVAGGSYSFTPTDLVMGRMDNLYKLYEEKKTETLDVTPFDELKYGPGTIFDSSKYNGYDLYEDYLTYLDTATQSSSPDGINDHSINYYINVGNDETADVGYYADVASHVTSNYLLENFYLLCSKVDAVNSTSPYLFNTETGAEASGQLKIRDLGQFLAHLGTVFAEDSASIETFDDFKIFARVTPGTANDMFAPGAVARLNTGPIGKNGTDDITLSTLYGLFNDLCYEGASVAETLSIPTGIMKTFLGQNKKIIGATIDPDTADVAEFSDVSDIDERINALKSTDPDAVKSFMMNHSLYQLSHYESRMDSLFESQRHLLPETSGDVYGVPAESPEIGYGIPSGDINVVLDRAAQLLLDKIEKESVDQNIIFLGLPKGMLDNKLINLVSQDSRRSFDDVSSLLKISFERDSEFSSLIKFKANDSEEDPGADITQIDFDLKYGVLRKDIMEAFREKSFSDFDDLALSVKFRFYSFKDVAYWPNVNEVEFSESGMTGNEIVEAIQSVSSSLAEKLRKRLILSVESEVLKYLFERVTYLNVDERYLNSITGKYISRDSMREALEAAAQSLAFKDAFDADRFLENIDAIMENLFEDDTSPTAMTFMGSNPDGDRIIKFTHNQSKLDKLFKSQLKRTSLLTTEWQEPILSTDLYNIIQDIAQTTFVMYQWWKNAIIPGTFDKVVAIRVKSLTDNNKYSVTIPNAETLTELGDVSLEQLQKFVAQGTGVHVSDSIASALSGPVTIDNFRAVLKVTASTLE